MLIKEALEMRIYLNKSAVSDVDFVRSTARPNTPAPKISLGFQICNPFETILVYYVLKKQIGHRERSCTEQ